MFSLKRSVDRSLVWAAAALLVCASAQAFPGALFPRLFPQPAAPAPGPRPAPLSAAAAATQTFSIPFEASPLFQAAQGEAAEQPLVARLVEPHEAASLDKIGRHVDQQIEQSLYAGQPAAARKGAEQEESDGGEEAGGEPQVVDKRDDKHEHEHEHHEHQHEHQHQQPEEEHHHERPAEAFEVHHKKGGKSFQYFHQGHHQHHRRRR